MNSSLDTSNRVVYLGGLPFKGETVDYQQYQQIVRNSFNSDDVEDVKVKDKKSPEGNYIYAFVTFKTPEAASKAVNNKTVEISGKQIVVERYSAEKDFQLYIKDVGSLTQKQIYDFFGKSKKVTN